MAHPEKLFLSLGIVVFALVLASRTQAAETPRIYVSNEDSGEITVVEPPTGQILRRIHVGKRPRGIKLTLDGKLLYVALSGSPGASPGVDESTLPSPDRTADGIGVVDVATFKLLRTLPSGQDPEAFDLSPDGKTIFISNEETAEVAVLDVATGKLTQKVLVGREPEGVTVRPDGKVVYVTCEGDSEVVAIDTVTLKVVSHMHTEPRPRSVVFTKDGSTAFATAERGAAVTVLDGIRHKTVGTITIPSVAGNLQPARPMGSVLAPDGSQIFVSKGRGGSVAVINFASHKVMRMIDNVGARPWGIGVSPDGRKIY